MPLTLESSPQGEALSSDWWRSAVIYQIYPRSFADSNGDGIGDLPSILTKLDYVASLGVDAVWISPFFKSPMQDFGYDISDYCAVDPIFGTLDDFKAVLAAAHDRGLKVLIDQVWNHTSEEHPWFMESRASRDSARADWYVWVDAKPDGTPPNNWLSTFGGSAWAWEPRRQQYYLHNFLASQPDLNWYNPAVVAAILDTARFWLELGVDGFRLDVVNFFTCDRSFADNPMRPPRHPAPGGGLCHRSVLFADQSAQPRSAHHPGPAQTHSRADGSLRGHHPGRDQQHRGCPAHLQRVRQGWRSPAHRLQLVADDRRPLHRPAHGAADWPGRGAV